MNTLCQQCRSLGDDAREYASDAPIRLPFGGRLPAVNPALVTHFKTCSMCSDVQDA